MTFEVLQPVLAQVEAGLAAKKSPRKIAKELGNPGLYSSIRNYKIAAFHIGKAAGEAWRIEQAKGHDERIAQGVAEIVDTLEVLNLGKLRAQQLLQVSLGDEFEVADGQVHKLTLGSASVYWPAGVDMLQKCAKLELEILGDDPESRKADAMKGMSDEELEERINELLQLRPGGVKEAPGGASPAQGGDTPLGFC